MSRSSIRALRNVALAGVAAAALAPSLAWGQAAPAEGGQASAFDKDEITVTGTLIRGVAPVGATPTTVTQKDIAATGATTVAQVLQTIPQLGSFGTLQTPLGISPEVSVNRPNLRSLPGFNTGGGSSTLVLLNGHRLVGMGSTTTTPDPDVIPPGVLERVEIVPDGGSAIYGSDAVAGVLNFITIKRFDGLKVDASYGFADSYYRYDANVTAGRDWGSGSIFASYSFAKGDQLIGLDRDYIRQFPAVGTGLNEIQCSPGNVGVGSPIVYRPIPSTTPGAPNQCDGSDYASVYPAYRRHSVFAGLTQQLSDAIKIDLTAFYTNRVTDVVNGPFRYSAAVTAAQARPPYAGLGAQTVYGQFGPNDASRSRIKLETWGVNSTVTADLGGSFQLRVMGGYGESIASSRATGLDTTALATLVGSGAFNPYDPNTASQGTIGLLTNIQGFGRTRQSMENLRAVVDGDLIALPAGAVKIAVGVEYSHETLAAQNGTTIPGFENGGFTGNGVNTVTKAIPIYRLGRSVKSAFGEMIVPIIGGGSGPELTVSAAARYDDYSDVGDTFNPRFGATFKPVEWVSIHGAWGKSFNAPSLADSPDAAATTVFLLPSFANGTFRPPADLVASGAYPAFVPGSFILAARGNAPGIRPQTATTWSLGVDIEPPFVPGLTFGVNYYNIDYKDFIGLPPFENADSLYRYNGNVIRTGSAITPAAIAAILGADTDGIIDPFGLAFGSPTPANTYAIFDARKTNIGRVKLDGIDFHANYRTETGFGALFFSTNGTYDLSRKQQIGSAPFVDLISKDASRFRVRSTVGAEVGNLLGQITWNHRAGYDFTAPAGFNGTALDGRIYTSQLSVGSFNTFDLFFRYDLKGSGYAQDLAFTLNIENVFDQAPPVYVGASSVGGQAGILNGNTIGRFARIGVSKKF